MFTFLVRNALAVSAFKKLRSKDDSRNSSGLISSLTKVIPGSISVRLACPPRNLHFKPAWQRPVELKTGHVVVKSIEGKFGSTVPGSGGTTNGGSMESEDEGGSWISLDLAVR